MAPWLGTLALLGLHACLCLCAWRRAGTPVRLEHDGQHWRVTLNPDSNAQRIHAGCTLWRGGHRGPGMLLMTFRDRDGERVDVEIYRDAVAPTAFGTLHLAMRFDVIPAAGGAALHSPAGQRRVESP